MKDPNLVKLGGNIRIHRELIGLSQEQLAVRAGLHRTYLGGVERGERNISILNLVRISAALGVKLTMLVDGISGFIAKEED